jgi:glutathione peroxidase
MIVRARVIVLFLALLMMGALPVMATSIYDFTMTSIDGEPVPLSVYKGKIVLIVNVASRSDYTPQYSALEAVYNKYKSRGFTVLGFPANNFGGSEPGTDAAIKSFCATNYHITFPMFSKISVKGDDIAPLYKYLTTKAHPNVRGDIRDSFTKFLVDRQGNVIARFEPEIDPNGVEIEGEIDFLLSQ